MPYLLNPVGIVGLMTISAEADSVSVFAVEFGILVFVLLLDVVVFRWANRVSDKLDENRMLVTEKVFGFLIAAIAVQLVLDGLVSVGVIGPVRIKQVVTRLGVRAVARAIVREVQDGLDVVGLAGVGVCPPVEGYFAGDQVGEPAGVGLGEGLGG